jgi:hypothetical protein
MVLLPPVRVLYMEDNEGAARLFKMRLERLGSAKGTTMYSPSTSGCLSTTGWK